MIELGNFTEQKNQVLESSYSILHNPTPPHIFVSPVLPFTK